MEAPVAAASCLAEERAAAVDQPGGPFGLIDLLAKTPSRTIPRKRHAVHTPDVERVVHWNLFFSVIA